LNFGLLKNSGSVNARDDFSTFLELMGIFDGYGRYSSKITIYI
jgi:hypothetical protein